MPTVRVVEDSKEALEVTITYDIPPTRFYGISAELRPAVEEAMEFVDGGEEVIGLAMSVYDLADSHASRSASLSVDGWTATTKMSDLDGSVVITVRYED